MADLLKGNEDQQKAIVLNRGPALILAGPGSGKTFTIVERIRYLIVHHGVQGENILVITFTKAAARQMRERFLAGMEGMAGPVNFGTFHAVFYHILKTSAPHISGAVLSEREKREYLQRVLLCLPGQGEVLPKSVGDGAHRTDVMAGASEEMFADSEWQQGLLGEFGLLKNAGRMPEDFRSAYLEEGTFKRAFLGFQRLLGQERKMDFDDFAAHCLHLFRSRPEVLAAWQEKFQYILVDEFQDINPAQYAVVKLLAGQGRNLFVVGDDDQSIYGFRASSPAIMKQFLVDFPEAQQINLSINYRCAPGIVDAAGKLISVNRERFAKQIRAGKRVAAGVGGARNGLAAGDCVKASAEEAQNRPAAGDGAKVSADESRPGTDGTPAADWKQFAADGSVWIGGFADRARQTAEVCRILEQLRERGENCGQIPSAAVIFRTNTDALPMAEALSRAGIPFFLQEKVKSPYAHFVCQDLLAYLRFVHQGQKRSDFYRIMNKPARYLSRQAVSGKQVFWGELLDFYKEKSWMLPYIRRFQTDAARIGGMDLYAAVHYIRRGVGYDGWLSKTLEGERLKQAQEAADFFRDSVREFASLELFEAHVETYEKQLEQSNLKRGGAGPGEVALLTMHGAKGLEFEQVFLPDCNEGVTPHKKSMKAKEVEEERRMFYVGMTRAKERLYISWVAGTPEDPGFPSRFLGDLGYKEPWRSA